MLGFVTVDHCHPDADKSDNQFRYISQPKIKHASKGWMVTKIWLIHAAAAKGSISSCWRSCYKRIQFFDSVQRVISLIYIETVTKYRQLGINLIIRAKLDFQILTWRNYYVDAWSFSSYPYVSVWQTWSVRCIDIQDTASRHKYSVKTTDLLHSKHRTVSAKGFKYFPQSLTQDERLQHWKQIEGILPYEYLEGWKMRQHRIGLRHL